MKLLYNLLCLILSIVPLSSSSMRPLCHDNERSALLQFKCSLSVNKLASSNPSAYPKIQSWKGRGNESDCCLWDGIQCDEGNNHVISLDLSSSRLHGSIHPNSTLFDLVHLERLNLADNDFRYSLILSEIGRLSNLMHLNLSQSNFFGQVPIEVAMLSKLITLDLSNNVGSSTGAPLLELQELGLETLVHNATSLEILSLGHVRISSRVPRILAHRTSLTSLLLDDSGIHGAFPEGIFRLPNLEILDVSHNSDLVGSLPEFLNGSKIQSINLRSTRFFGLIPNSISKLGSLTAIHIINCSFHGPIPDSVGKLTKLRHLGLSYNNLEGRIPTSLANLTQLVHLALGGNKLIGEIPSFIANFTQLIVLDLGSTQLRGSIPAWISRLENLKSLNLGANNFSGNVELDMFLALRGLQILDLSNLDLVLPNRTRKNDTLPQFASLLLQSCNLTRVPDFLANQKQLKYLDLANNKIQGSLVIPSPYLIFIDLSNNELSGEIPPLICNASSLNILDLMYNNLSGEIPSCLGNLGNMFVLNLHANSFEGTIPDTFTSTSKLKWITLSSNQVQGPIPRSLVNCSSLEVLDLSNNRINDTFPIWLGGLPSLRALILGSNKLHGMMPLEFGHAFPSLHVIDLSNNMLTGNLSSELFLYNRQAMEVKYPIGTSYLLTVVSDITSDMELQQTCIYLFTITNKGREAFDEKILNVFTSIDLSNNRFTGKIPTSIGNLVGLQALNLSHNNLIGGIPLSLGNLSSLESLDLSSNMLSGNIPQQLTSLTFLEIFNVSYNNLTGAIPKGKQFDTFENISFEGNIGLCGGPLSKKCGDLQLAPPASQGQPNSSYEEDDSSTMVDWLIISFGYLSGLVVGLVLGNFLTAKYGLFSVTLGRRAATKQQQNLIN